MKPEINYSLYYDKHMEYVSLREKNNEIYDKYKDDVLHWKLIYLKEVSKELNPRNILEVGCAVGFMLSNVPFDIVNGNRYGIDISPKNIDSAKESFPDMNFFACTISEFNSQNSIMFDLVLLSDILEHVEDDLDFLLECKKKGSRLLVNLPLEKCGEYKNRKYGFDDWEGHLRAYSAKDAEKLFDKAGLSVVNHRVDRYVDQPIFRQYLLNKLLSKYKDKAAALVKYEQELLHIQLNRDYYKSNLFVLLDKK